MKISQENFEKESCGFFFISYYNSRYNL